MPKHPIHIKFNNQQNPHAGFDVINLEETLQKDLDHSLFELHLVEFYIILLSQQ